MVTMTLLTRIRHKVLGYRDGTKPCGCTWPDKEVAQLPPDPEDIVAGEVDGPFVAVSHPPHARHTDTVTRTKLMEDGRAATSYLHLNIHVWRCLECGDRFEYGHQPLGETVEWADGTVDHTGLVEQMHEAGHPDAPGVPRDR